MKKENDLFEKCIKLGKELVKEFEDIQQKVDRNDHRKEYWEKVLRRKSSELCNITMFNSKLFDMGYDEIAKMFHE